MFTAIATLAFQTGGDAVISDIEKRFPFDAYCPHLGFARGEGAITEFRAWARQSYEEACA
jgi:hypothetical protein